jgi:hypothetical protein
MNENENYTKVSELIRAGKVLKPINECAQKAFALLGIITSSQRFEIQNLMQWSKLLNGRYKGLQEKNVHFGGIEESISVLNTHNSPVDLITLQSDLYVSMFLVSKEDEQLVGAYYIERDQGTGSN